MFWLGHHLHSCTDLSHGWIQLQALHWLICVQTSVQWKRKQIPRENVNAPHFFFIIVKKRKEITKNKQKNKQQNCELLKKKRIKRLILKHLQCLWGFSGNSGVSRHWYNSICSSRYSRLKWNSSVKWANVCTTVSFSQSQTHMIIVETVRLPSPYGRNENLLMLFPRFCLLLQTED